MTGPPTFDRINEATLDRHRQIHFFLERVERAVEALDDTGADLEPLRRLPAVLDSLIERIEEHNRDEEDGGLLQDVADAVPEVEDQVLVLTDQHVRFRTALREARARAVGSAPTDVPALRAALLDLVRALRDHERTEERLLERARAAGTGPVS